MYNNNKKIKGALKAILLIRNNVRLILVFLDGLNEGREGRRGYFTVLINSLVNALESMLLALYAFPVCVVCCATVLAVLVNKTSFAHVEI